MAKRRKKVFISVIEETQSVASSKENVRTREGFGLVSYASLNKSNRLLSVVSFTQALSGLIAITMSFIASFFLQDLVPF